MDPINQNMTGCRIELQDFLIVSRAQVMMNVRNEVRVRNSKGGMFANSTAIHAVSAQVNKPQLPIKVASGI